MYKEYINVECSEKMMSLSDFAKLQYVVDNLPPVYLDDEYDYYDLLLKKMYELYLSPVIVHAENYKYQSPIIPFPVSCYLNMQCTTSTSVLSVVLYNEDQHPLFEIVIYGHELVNEWTSEGSQIAVNLAKYFKNIENEIKSNCTYFSFTLQKGFTFTRDIILEYNSKPLFKSNM